MQYVWKPLLVLGMVVSVSGCGQTKTRIAQLEDERLALHQQLEDLRAEMDGVKQQRDRCQEDLFAAQRAADDLTAQLSARPAPQLVIPAPAQELPSEWTSVPGGAMLAIPGNVLFASGKTTLRKDSQSMLAQVASELESTFAGKDVYVFGHTDTDPIRKSGWKDNRELSTERALAVVRYLQSRVSPSRLVACGWGEHRPVASNGTKEGKARNRRVEIYAVDPTLASAR